jgi:predicted nucleotidyltransferase
LSAAYIEILKSIQLLLDANPLVVENLHTYLTLLNKNITLTNSIIQSHKKSIPHMTSHIKLGFNDIKLKTSTTSSVNLDRFLTNTILVLDKQTVMYGGSLNYKYNLIPEDFPPYMKDVNHDALQSLMDCQTLSDIVNNRIKRSALEKDIEYTTEYIINSLDFVKDAAMYYKEYIQAVELDLLKKGFDKSAIENNDPVETLARLRFMNDKSKKTIPLCYPGQQLYLSKNIYLQK